MESHYSYKIDVILFPNKQNFSLRGHRENFDSKNQGKFLETV